MANEDKKTSDQFDAAYQDALITCRQLFDNHFMGRTDTQQLIATMHGYQNLFKDSLSTRHFTSTINLLTDLVEIKTTQATSELRTALPTFMEYVLEDLYGHIQANPREHLLPAYKLGKSFARSNQPKLYEISTNIFAANFDQFIDSAELENSDIHFITKHLIDTSNVDQYRTLIRMAVHPDSAFNKRFQRKIDSILNISIFGLNTRNRPERMAVALNEITGGYAQQLMNAWDDSVGKERSDHKTSEPVYFENFAAIFKLEKHYFGITQFLIEQYGILNFARYPLEILIEQFEQHNQKDKPYGVFVTARYDHNKATFSIKDETKYAYEQAKKHGYGFKIFEAENVDDILGAINSAHQNNGKLSYLFIVAHGHTDTINLGINEGAELSIAGIAEKASEFNQTRNSFTEDAIITLISCSTGEAGGVAQILSEVIRDIDIHSPDYIVFLKKKGIHISKSHGKIQIKTLFGYVEGNYNTIQDFIHALTNQYGSTFNFRTLATNFYDIPTRVYRNGELLRDYTK